MDDISVVKVEKDGKIMALIFGGDYNYRGRVYTLNLETMKAGTVDKVSYQRYGHSSSLIDN